MPRRAPDTRPHELMDVGATMLDYGGEHASAFVLLGCSRICWTFLKHLIYF